MSQRFGIDAARLPAVRDMKAAGVTFAVGYVSSSAWKAWTPVMIGEVRAAGIDPVFVFEDGGQRALLGRAAGLSDGRFAAQAMAALGAPKGQPVYFAVDFNPTAAEMPKVLDYFRGVADAIGKTRCGVYGGLPAVKAVLDAGLVGYAWQTYAWSAGALDPRANLYQYSNGHGMGGSVVDFDRAYTADFGQWAAPVKPQPPTPKGNTVAAITFTDAYEYAQAIAAGKTDAQARAAAEVTYNSTDAALAGFGSYISSILRDVKQILANQAAK